MDNATVTVISAGLVGAAIAHETLRPEEGMRL